MTAFTIYIVVAFVLAGIAAYKYGRVHPNERDYILQETFGITALFIVFWPVVVPVGIAVAAIYFPLRWIYKLGERSCEKDNV